MRNCFLIILLILTTSCVVENVQSDFDITKAIPVNSDLIIKIHDINKINEKSHSFEWWNKLKNIEALKHILNSIHETNKIYNLNELFENKIVYLSSVLIGENKTNFLLITSISETDKKTNKLIRTQESSEKNTKIYEGITINKIKIDLDNNNDVDLFFAVHNEVFILSFSQMRIEESIRQLKHDTNIFKTNPIDKLNRNLPKYSDVNILVKTQFIESIIGQKNIFLNSDTWSWFDVEMEKNSILLNGVTNRGNVKYLQNSQYSNAKQSNIENILPRHTKGLYKYQINDESDLNEVINIISPGLHENIYHLSNNDCKPKEIDIAYDDDSFSNISYLIFEPDNKKDCINYLNNNDSDYKSKYLDYEINSLNSLELNENLWLKELIENWDATYYVIIQKHVVLSHSVQKIKSLINNIVSNQTISTSQAINIINEKIGTKSHTSFYLNFKNQNEDWKQIFNSVVSKNIGSEEYFFNSLFFLSENTEFKNPAIWTFNLQNETNYKPQIVTNHYTSKMEIFTQDIENNIYLIDANGSQLWMKSIGNAIIGDVHQIDTYKNKKLQYLFNTKDSIYVIDRNGTHVSPFPIKSKKPMSLPLAVFDYDNTKNYRILVPMENEMVMYSQKGEIISGWECTELNSNITMTPEHYQLFNKDYIIISEEDDRTYLLNRKGQQRVSIKDKISRSKNKINLIQGNTLYDSKLIMTNKEGKIIYITFNGQVDTLTIQNLTQEDKYIRNNNYTLILKGKELIFSTETNKFEYTFKSKPNSTPQVLLKKSNGLIAIHNKTENLIYLLNEKGELNMQPLFGTTDFSMEEFEDKIHLIVGSSEGVIYNYKIN